MKIGCIILLLAAPLATAQTVTSQYTARLTDSGDNPPLMPVVADAREPAETGLTPALQVNVPAAQTPRLLGFVNPAIAIPFNSSIRQVEAYWNGQPLPLIDSTGTELVDEAHSYATGTGSMIPFFKPLFSVSGQASGAGTLEIRGFDAARNQIASVSIPNLTIAAPPAPVSTATIASARPRIYLTPSRLAVMRARGMNDPAGQRYAAALQLFQSALASFPNATSPEFENRLYDAENYIPLLALTYQLRKDSDPATAMKLAAAAHALTMRIANDYDTGKRTFGHDTGYDIRFGLRDLMLAYDWMYDQFSASERALIAKIATQWVDWYHTNPGAYSESHPVENYYAGYLQGIALTSIALAGDSPDAGRFLTLLRTKLLKEAPLMNQRLSGGDWAEGWNYGPYSALELSLVNTALRDAGEDWSASFDWLQTLPRSLTYMVAPDFSETRSFGEFTGNYPHRTSPSMLAVLSTTTRDGAYAYRLYTSMNANPNNDFQDQPHDTFYEMIFAPATGTSAGNVTGLPLSYMNAGTGRFFSRSSLTDANGWFVSAENISEAYDHYGYSNGDVRLYHGNICLVCPSAYRLDMFDETGTPEFSTYRVNGSDQPLGLGRNNQILFSIEAGTYSAVGMRFESSYVTGRFDESIVDPADPLDYLIREVVHLRPGTLVVRDLHRRRHPGDTLLARWHIGVPDSVTTVAPGRYRAGALNVSTFYPAGVTASFTSDTFMGSSPVGTLMQLDFASSTAPMELITVFSETLTASTYANGTVTLSDGSRVTFAKGSVSVQGSAPTRRRAVR